MTLALNKGYLLVGLGVLLVLVAFFGKGTLYSSVGGIESAYPTVTIPNDVFRGSLVNNLVTPENIAAHDYVYHVTQASNLDSIMSLGLLESKQTVYNLQYPDSVFWKPNEPALVYVDRGLGITDAAGVDTFNLYLDKANPERLAFPSDYLVFRTSKSALVPYVNLDSPAELLTKSVPPSVFDAVYLVKLDGEVSQVYARTPAIAQEFSAKAAQAGIDAVIFKPASEVTSSLTGHVPTVLELTKLYDRAGYSLDYTLTELNSGMLVLGESKVVTKLPSVSVLESRVSVLETVPESVGKFFAGVEDGAYIAGKEASLITEKTADTGVSKLDRVIMFVKYPYVLAFLGLAVVGYGAYSLRKKK